MHFEQSHDIFLAFISLCLSFPFFWPSSRKSMIPVATSFFFFLNNFDILSLLHSFGGMFLLGQNPISDSIS